MSNKGNEIQTIKDILVDGVQVNGNRRLYARQWNIMTCDDGESSSCENLCRRAQESKPIRDGSNQVFRYSIGKGVVGPRSYVFEDKSQLVH